MAGPHEPRAACNLHRAIGAYRGLALLDASGEDGLNGVYADVALSGDGQVAMVAWGDRPSMAIPLTQLFRVRASAMNAEPVWRAEDNIRRVLHLTEGVWLVATDKKLITLIEDGEALAAGSEAPHAVSDWLRLDVVPSGACVLASLAKKKAFDIFGQDGKLKKIETLPLLLGDAHEIDGQVVCRLQGDKGVILNGPRGSMRSVGRTFASEEEKEILMWSIVKQVDDLSRTALRLGFVRIHGAQRSATSAAVEAHKKIISKIIEIWIHKSRRTHASDPLRLASVWLRSEPPRSRNSDGKKNITEHNCPIGHNCLGAIVSMGWMVVFFTAIFPSL